MNLKFSAAILLFFLSSILTVRGEETDTLGATLSEFTLTASPTRSLIPGQELSGGELERLSAINVADAVKFFSGVQIKDYGGVGGVKTLDVRSMGSNNLGVFYDGIALGNAQNGQIDLGKYSLDNIESISIFNGQKSDIFTTARDLGSASAIYLRTRRPEFADNKKYNLRLRFRTGSFGLVNPSLNFDFRFNHHLSATLSAEYTGAHGRYKFRLKGYYPDGAVAWDTTAVRQNGDIRALRSELTLFGKYHSGDYMVKAYFYDSERGIPGAIVNNVWKNSQRQWDRNLHLQGRWKGDISRNVSLMVNAKYARDYLRYLNPDTTQRYVDNKFYQDELYASISSQWRILSNLSLSGAFDYQYNTLSSTMRDFADPRRHALWAALSARWEIQRLAVQGNVLVNYNYDLTSNPLFKPGSNIEKTLHKDKTAFSGGLYLNWRPFSSHEFSVRGFIKRSFRMPTFNDLYYTDVGNANLNPEYVTQYDLGITERLEFTSTIWKYLEIKGDIYYNDVKDKILAIPKGNSQYRWMMTNIGRVKIRGIDLNVEAAISPLTDLSVGVRLSYSYQRALDYTNPKDSEDEFGTYKGQIAYVPVHSGSANLFAGWRRLEFNYSFLYVGERWRSSSNSYRSYEKPWWTNDMTLSYTLPLKKVSFRLQIELNNIFNRQYHIIVNYPMPGRNWRVGLTFTI